MMAYVVRRTERHRYPPTMNSKILLIVFVLFLVMPNCRAEEAGHKEHNPDRSSTGTWASIKDLTATEQRILDCIKKGEYKTAKQILQLALRAEGLPERNNLLSLLSYVDLQLSNKSAAIRDLCKIDQTLQTPRQKVLVQKLIADMHLKSGKESYAISAYKEALASCAELDRNDPLVVDILQPLIGRLLHNEEYREAQPFAERLIDICRERAHSKDLYDEASLFYAYCKLLQIYRETNMRLHQQVLAEMMPFLDRLLKLRSANEGDTIESESAAFNEIQNSLLRSCVANNTPARLSDLLWLDQQFRPLSLPLIDWQPEGRNPKAVLLCIHALGLENRAFMPFGRAMVKKGFAIYAMDVRGFGAWQSDYGSETVHFKRALDDIRVLIQILNTRHPNLPVFLVGESMGGALALRAASEFGCKIDGVISSVPSAERYGEAKMASKVALHFLRNPNKPFNIVSDIASQATTSKDLIQVWKNDPKAKIGLSPIELIEFDRFMKTTKARCSLINKPVIVVQGLADKLVKPAGTYEMFNKVNSSDKALILIGNADHLILETTNQSELLLEGLSAWLHKHINKQNAFRNSE